MKQVFVVHVYEGTASYSSGEREISSWDFRNSPDCMENRVWLTSSEIEIDIPDVDTRQAQIEQLEAILQKEKADSQMRINHLLDRISKLQAIGYEDW